MMTHEEMVKKIMSDPAVKAEYGAQAQEFTQWDELRGRGSGPDPNPTGSVGIRPTIPTPPGRARPFDSPRRRGFGRLSHGGSEVQAGSLPSPQRRRGPDRQFAEAAAQEDVVPELSRHDGGQAQVHDDPLGGDAGEMHLG